MYRNGHGKPRRLTLTSGTITVRRPRVRDLNERFVSRVLPLFKRQTKEVGELLPQLYLHGLALGDFELALRGLLGDGAPLSLLRCCGSSRSGSKSIQCGSSGGSMTWKWSTCGPMGCMSKRI